MAKFSGIKGNVTIASGTGNWGGDGSSTGIKVANIKSWSMDLKSDVKDVTTFASAGFRENIAANQSATGKIEMFADDTVVLAIGTSSNPTVTLKLYDGASDRQFSFVAVLESISTNVDGMSGDSPVVTFSFVSTSTITPA